MLIYVDAINGAAGDMLLGALCDAGADFARVQSDLHKLLVGGYELALTHVYHGEVRATRLAVEVTVEQPHRHLSDVVAIIAPSPLPEVVKTRAISIFRRLAEAEGKVHGVSPEEVHFHEVGAVDAIVDVVGTCLALHQLEEQHGSSARVFVSELPVGKGMVTCAHGPMPVPVPAVCELLVGVPVYDNGESGELVTPTGAAILVTLAQGFGAMPRMALKTSGYGGGTRQGKNVPNVLRVLVGDEMASSGLHQESAVMLAANLDDASPQQVAHAADRLLAAGALDVTTTPTVMKKGRAGVILEVLSAPESVNRLTDLILAQTSTLGVRSHTVERRVLDRRWETVPTPWGEVRIKLGLQDGQVVNVMPEFADCEALALTAQVPLKVVWQAAMARYGAKLQV